MAPSSDKVAAAIDLLQRLIATPSLSRDEAAAADVVERWLADRGIRSHRHINNVWALAADYRPDRPTLMLNSHIDTVKPSPAYTRPPYTPTWEGDRLYGLGSNDAGASGATLSAVFAWACGEKLPYNLILALSAEEEVGGENGMRSLLPHLAEKGIKVDMAIVGEPTSMQPAIAERGLLVMDCVARGVSGHAARNEGVNALYKAVDDINTLRNFAFERVSPTLGPIKITVTQIEAGRQHNVVPDECRFVVDVRTTDAYSNEETHALLDAAIGAESKARSYRTRPSVIALDHPLVSLAVEAGRTPYVSNTSSDMARMPFPSLKLGPGESSRSHTADEFITIDELTDATEVYTAILQGLKNKV